MSRVFGSERLFAMKKSAHHSIVEVPRSGSKVEMMTIGIDLWDVWSHYCTVTKMAKSWAEGGSEQPPQESTGGSPLCRRFGL
jgi:hypothetical protein